MASVEQRNRLERELRLARRSSVVDRPVVTGLVGGLLAAPPVRDSLLEGAVGAMRLDAAKRSRTAPSPLTRARAEQVLAEAEKPSAPARSRAQPRKREDTIDDFLPQLSGEAREIELEAREQDRLAAELQAEREAAAGELSAEELARWQADPWGDWEDEPEF